LHIEDKGSTRRVAGKYCVAYNDRLLAALRERLGDGNVIIK
jgi:hypothetical protein